MAETSDAMPQPPTAEQPFHSLYRRFRPQRFAEVRGQEHVTRALLNTVRDGRVAHAYLFSGPRGTGKTSTARILAMALNCENPVDGEPDGTCPSCVDIRRGVSVDVQELDAASNRRIDEMRDLLSRVALGTRGRWKVYIIDEVHQLTSDAASALLKTLEEPPGHVVFVLATTDPQKVLPTIRSRTIPFEFHLLPSEVLGGLLHDINKQAGLGVPPEAIDLVVRRGHGSARDALTVLDQVAAGGAAMEDQVQVVSQIVDGLAERDAGAALTAVAEGMAAGRDPRRLAADLLDHLRNGFLATMARGLVMLPDDAVAEVAAQARRLGLAALVRAMELIGEALADMRDSVDPRVTLEVALVRLARPDADTSIASLLERIERLERAAGGDHAAPGGPSAPRGSDRPPRSPVPPPPAVPPRRAAPHGSPAPPAPPVGGRSPSPTAGAAPPTAEAAPPVPAPPPPAGAPPAPPSRTAVPSAPALQTPAGAAPAVPAPPSGAATALPVLASPGLAPPTGAATALPVLAPPAGTAGTPPRAGPASGARAQAGPASGAPAPPAPAGASRQRPAAGPAAAGGPAGRAPLSPSRPMPSRDELTKAWGDGVLHGLSARAKLYLGSGRFVSVNAAGALFALPNQEWLGRCLDLRAEAEAALAARFHRPIPLKLVVEAAAAAPVAPAGAAAPVEPPEAELLREDLDHLQDAGAGVVSPEQRLLDAFPGAEEVST